MTRNDVEQQAAAELDDWRSRISRLREEVAGIHQDSLELLEAEYQAYLQVLGRLRSCREERWEAVRTELAEVRERLQRAWERALEAIR